MDAGRQLDHDHAMTASESPALARGGAWLQNGPDNRSLNICFYICLRSGPVDPNVVRQSVSQ